MAEVRLEVDVAHPPERVWRALTEARLLGEWFMTTDLEPREGSTFTFDPGSLRGFRGKISGELVEVAACRRVVMLWQAETMHTRVTWELAEIVGGCKLRVVQSGFIGAPATTRRRELRHTYSRLFAELLPVTLERLAAGEVDLGGAVAPLRTAVPRQQRRSRANVPVGVWAAGRRRWARTSAPAVPAGTEPAAAQTPAADVVAAATPADPLVPAAPMTVPAPRRSTEGHPADATRAGEGGGQRRRARFGAFVPRGWRRWAQAAPAWLRFGAIGTAAAVLAIAILAALSSAGDLNRHGVPPAEQPHRAGPGFAVQPGTHPPGSSPTAGAGTGEGAGSRSAAGQAAPSPGGSQPSPGGSEPSPGGGEPPTAPTPGPAPAPVDPDPELTATASHSAYGLLGLGGRRVTMTIYNPGPGDAETWTVRMDVGTQQVTNVTGAGYERDGTTAIFTPTGSGLVESESSQFSFDIPSSGLLGLGGTDPPTDCTIDDQPCG